MKLISHRANAQHTKKKAKRNAKRNSVRQQRAKENKERSVSIVSPFLYQSRTGNESNFCQVSSSGPITIVRNDMSQEAIDFKEKLSGAVDYYYNSMCSAGGFEPAEFERNVLYNTLYFVLCGSGAWWCSTMTSNFHDLLDNENDWQYCAWNCVGCNYAGWFLFEIVKDQVEIPDNVLFLGGGDFRPGDKEWILKQFGASYLLKWSQCLFSQYRKMESMVYKSKYSDNAKSKFWSYID